MFIRENSDCCAACVNEVQTLSNFTWGDYLPKGAKLSPDLKEWKKKLFIFSTTLLSHACFLPAPRSLDGGGGGIILHERWASCMLESPIEAKSSTRGNGVFKKQSYIYGNVT